MGSMSDIFFIPETHTISSVMHRLTPDKPQLILAAPMIRDALAAARLHFVALTPSFSTLTTAFS